MLRLCNPLLFIYFFFDSVLHHNAFETFYMFVSQYINKDSTPISDWLKTTITIQLKLGQAVRRQN